MPKFAFWVAVLTLPVSASAQTADSLQSELTGLAQSVLKLYSTVGQLRFDTNATSIDCAKAGIETLDVAGNIKEYINKAEVFFKSPGNSRYSYIYKASVDLYGAASAIVSAANKICLTDPRDKETGSLYVDLASLRLDVFFLEMGKEDR